MIMENEWGFSQFCSINADIPTEQQQIVNIKDVICRTIKPSAGESHQLGVGGLGVCKRKVGHTAEEHVITQFRPTVLGVCDLIEEGRLTVYDVSAFIEQKIRDEPVEAFGFQIMYMLAMDVETFNAHIKSFARWLTSTYVSACVIDMEKGLNQIMSKAHSASIKTESMPTMPGVRTIKSLVDCIHQNNVEVKDTLSMWFHDLAQIDMVCGREVDYNFKNKYERTVYHDQPMTQFRNLFSSSNYLIFWEYVLESYEDFAGYMHSETFDKGRMFERVMDSACKRFGHEYFQRGSVNVQDAEALKTVLREYMSRNMQQMVQLLRMYDRLVSLLTSYNDLISYSSDSKIANMSDMTDASVSVQDQDVSEDSQTDGGATTQTSGVTTVVPIAKRAIVSSSQVLGGDLYSDDQYSLFDDKISAPRGGVLTFEQDDDDDEDF